MGGENIIHVKGARQTHFYCIKILTLLSKNQLSYLEKSVVLIIISLLETHSKRINQFTLTISGGPTNVLRFLRVA